MKSFSLDSISKFFTNGFNTVIFNELYDNGTKSAAWTFDPVNGQYQKATISASCTLTITSPSPVPGIPISFAFLARKNS